MNIPCDFKDYTQLLMGDELYRALERGLQDTPPTSIRINPFKISPRTAAVHPASSHVPIGWCREGFWLDSRPNFTFDPLLHAGYYYVQEAASMFLSHVLRHIYDRPGEANDHHGEANDHPRIALDLCAAPGGKSTVVRSCLPDGCLLICNEPIRQRAQILSENIQKFGHPDVIVTNNYPRDFRKTGILYDLIIADVPCSGEGMFRKDPDAITEWRKQNVENCRQLQRQIISDIWPCLKPGGILVYSTCTFNAAENEENIEWIKTLGARDIDIATEASWNITGALTGDSRVYRFIPGVSRSEGLCMAVLRKDGDKATDEHRARGERTGRRGIHNSGADSWLTDSDRFTIVRDADALNAIPTTWEAVYQKAARHLKIIHAGIQLGIVKGKDIIPQQSLALSCQLDRRAFPEIGLDYRQAISYLRKENISLPPDTPRGFALVSYHGAPLGFVKHLGNRTNNLYPQEWRIKSSHLPDNGQNILNI